MEVGEGGSGSDGDGSGPVAAAAAVALTGRKAVFEKYMVSGCQSRRAKRYLRR